MKRSAEILSGIALQVFLTSVVVWIFCFSKVNNPFTVMQIRYPLLFLGSALSYIISYFLVRKVVPFPLYAILQIFMTAGGVFLCLYSIKLEPSVTRTIVIICAVYAVTFPVSAYTAYEHVEETGILIRFDLSAFMIIILLALDKWLAFPARTPALISCLTALLVSLVAIIASRAGRMGKNPDHLQGSRYFGRFFLLMCLGALVLLTALIYFFASSSLESAADGLVSVITVIAGAIGSAARFLYQLFTRFIEWLAGLCSGSDAPMEPEEMISGGFSPEITVEGEAQVPVWFYIVFGLIVIALLAFLLFRLRKHRVKKAKKTKWQQAPAVTKTNHFKSSFRTLFIRLLRSLRFRILAFRYKKTVPGLLLFCERKASGDLKRRRQESGEAFLRRLAFSQPSEDRKTALLTLADLAEQYFYSGGERNLQPVDAELIRNVRKAF